MEQVGLNITDPPDILQESQTHIEHADIRTNPTTY